jgi:quercetin dioxygenase-like cupin family protein
VVTGHDAGGRAVVVSDGVPPQTSRSPDGLGISELWQVPGPPLTAGSGGDPQGPWELEPPPGGASWRVFRLPPTGAPATGPEGARGPHFDPERPGMHRTDTIDLIQLLSGRVELALDDSAVELTAGDCVVQRGTMHAWKVLGDAPAEFSAVMLRSIAGGDPGHRGVGPRPPAGAAAAGVRRVVTRVDEKGRSVFASDGPPPNALAPDPGGMAYADLWQTLGPVYSPDAGGDAPPGALQVLPLGGGIAWKRVALPPREALAPERRGLLAEQTRARMAGMGAGGQFDPEHPGRHRTDTIDFVQVLRGELRLVLDGDARDLRAGDCVVQRGTWHSWLNTGREPCVFVAVMLTTQPLEDRKR